VGHGLARVTVSFDDWKNGHVASSVQQVAIVRPKRRIVLEEVSPRLRAELVHPDREATLAGIRFSPDGRQLIAGSYPDGNVQLWDVETGRQLTKIESGHGYRSTFDYFFASPDWSILYDSRMKQIHEAIEKDGKKLRRWAFESEIRAWDLATGELKNIFRQSPMRGIRWIILSPDGRTLMTDAEPPGESEGRPKPIVSRVDTRTGEFRDLPGSLLLGAFSGDGRTLVVNEIDDEMYMTAFTFFDTATGTARRTIPILEQPSQVGQEVFSPDGKWCALVHRVFPRRGDRQGGKTTLKLFDVDSGHNLLSLPFDEQDEPGGALTFSPDGRTLATSNWRGNQCQLLLFDIARQKLAHRVDLRADRAFMRPRAFSPDGRWIVIGTELIPSDADDDSSAEDFEQPRIHLVEAATGKVRETLIAPQGFMVSGCFSPDGKTLATAGNGRVLLWDLATLPGE
jgi:WD40 repeat protein